MKKNIISYILIVAAACMVASCEKDDIRPQVNSPEPTALTSEQLNFRDSVIASIQALDPQQVNARSQRIVSLSARQLSCNRFRVTVNINQQLCPRPEGTSLIGYWTLFESRCIKNLNPTQGRPCFNVGPQFNINLSVTGTNYLYIVLLYYDSQTRTASNILISNTIVLTPGC